jgi:cytoskeleton protein RodZ
VSEKEDNGNDSVRPGGIGPGERLQAARIKKGLTIDDVASRMHLSASILVAIEENNFDEITAPIFVKGYLRAYARIVSLSEDEMIQQYIDFYSEEDPPIGSTSNMAPELSVSDARIKWTTYLVILVLGVLLAAWWWNKQQNEVAPISLDAQSSRVEESAPVAQAGGANNIESESDSSTGSTAADDMPAAETVEPEISVTTESEPAPVEEPPAADSSTAETGVAPAQGATESIGGEAEATAPDETSPATEPEATALAPAPGTRELPTRVAPTGTDKLQIIVHADTWADVKDANNHQLLYDLLRADSLVELSGEAPFAVFLGNGHGVEVLFNGAEISFASKIRDDNTARLKVGG